MQETCRAFSWARASAGRSIAASNAMMAITTSNSISVKAELFLLKLVTVFSPEPVAGRKIGLSFIILPDLVKARLPGFGAQCFFAVNSP